MARVSIAKKAGAAVPVGKNKNVILIRVDDIDHDVSGSPIGFPTRNGALAVGNIALKAGAKALAIYCTPMTINRFDTSDGEGDARKITSNFTGEHPGDHEDINTLLQDYLNEDLIIISRECSDSTGTRIQGTPCNPMKMQFEGVDNNESKKKTLTFAQDMGDKFVMLHYNGTIPTLEDYAVDASSEDSGI